MAHFVEDTQHKSSTRIGSVIPDFIESDNPQFVEFIKAYYRFLEQYDSKPLYASYELQTGVVSIQSGNSTVIGANTEFETLEGDQRIRVGSDIFRIRSIADDTELIVYELPVRSYFANSYSAEVDKTVRQASGAIRQILTFHDIEDTLESFIPYFRDTYMRDIPQGNVDTAVLIPKVLDFYQAKGSEEAFKFLFRALYGKEIELFYPRDYVFATSDADYQVTRLLRLSRSNPGITYANSFPVKSELFELRQIVGLTSNARAIVMHAVDTYDGPAPIVALDITDIRLNRIVGGILLNSDIEADDGKALLATTYGVPPNGLSSIVYEYNITQELAAEGQFIAGEYISTVPENDPLAIRGVISGSVVGFTIDQPGQNYQHGDLVYPPPGYNGGYNAIGRIVGFSNTDIASIAIVDGGEGYYAGLSLQVDNSGTGGSGLAGYVINVSPGNIVLHADAINGVEDGDTLLFTSNNEVGSIVEFDASRETTDYYERGIGLEDFLGRILINDEVIDSADRILAENGATEYFLEQDQVPTLGAVNWSTNSLSALYNSNLQNIIVGVTSNVAIHPIYIDGVRTAIGEVFTIFESSLGMGYTSLPSISVNRVFSPTDANGSIISLSYVPYETANIVAVAAVGQIGKIEVLGGGSGYSTTNSFSLNSTTSSTTTGNGASVGIVIGALSTSQGRFSDTRGQLSADRYLQDITYYQPFSYVITVEDDAIRYAETVKALVHPAGGLLLTRQTITSVLDLTTNASHAIVSRSVGSEDYSLTYVDLSMSVIESNVGASYITAIIGTSDIAANVVFSGTDTITQGSSGSDLLYAWSEQVVNGSAYIYFATNNANTLYTTYQGALPGPSANSPGLG